MKYRFRLEESTVFINQSRARTLDQWHYGGQWWREESARVYFLLEHGNKTLEVYHEPTSGQWVLVKFHD